MDVITTIVEFLKVNLNIIIQTVGVFSLIATQTPNKVDNQIAQFLANVVNFLGANLNKSANKED